MTKQGEVRDWELDMERCKDFTTMESKGVYIKALEYWLQQYAAEKERADKAEQERRMLTLTMLKGDRIIKDMKEDLDLAEAREKKLREAIEEEIKCHILLGTYKRADQLRELLASLYPKEGEAK